MIQVRKAVATDADQLCDVHVEAWRVAYRGLVPDAYLDSPEFPAARLAGWRQVRWFDNGGEMLVVEVAGEPAGFGHCGPERADAAGTSRGEVYGFYLHPRAWGSGAAAPLMSACEAHLQAVGFDAAVLWVLRDNPRARRFYERAGWAATGEHMMWEGPQMPGTRGPSFTPLPEVQYSRSLR